MCPFRLYGRSFTWLVFVTSVEINIALQRLYYVDVKVLIEIAQIPIVAYFSIKSAQFYC
jgi:hypothetical protein